MHLTIFKKYNNDDMVCHLKTLPSSNIAECHIQFDEVIAMIIIIMKIIQFQDDDMMKKENESLVYHFFFRKTMKWKPNDMDVVPKKNIVSIHSGCFLAREVNMHTRHITLIMLYSLFVIHYKSYILYMRENKVLLHLHLTVHSMYVGNCNEWLTINSVSFGSSKSAVNEKKIN